jgi:hypothetical protein
MKKTVFLVLIQIFVSLNMFSQYYFYVSLSSEKAKIADGQEVDTKRMILTK